MGMEVILVMKGILITVVVVLCALIVYDKFIKKMIGG
jgi:hypothetical protein